MKLHGGMADELSTAQFAERFSANTRLFEQLAGQLISTVIDTHGDRYSDDHAVAQIQAWQRDPLIGELVAAYRRDRHRNPTSDGWLVLGTGGAKNPDPKIEEVTYA